MLNSLGDPKLNFRYLSDVRLLYIQLFYQIAVPNYFAM